MNNENLHITLGMSGKMGSGKDYATDYLISEYEKRGLKVTKLAFADALRDEVNELAEMFYSKMNKDTEHPSEVMQELANKMNTSVMEIISMYDEFMRDDDYNAGVFNCHERRSNRQRALLQYWGTEVRRAQNTNYWVEQAKKKAISLHEEGYNIVIIVDCRFPNEADGVKELNGKVIRVEVRSTIQAHRLGGRGTSFDIQSLTHSSETSLDDYSKFDYIFHSNNKTDLANMMSFVDLSLTEITAD